MVTPAGITRAKACWSEVQQKPDPGTMHHPDRGSATDNSSLVPIDGHVHFYDIGRVDTSLSAARRNFCDVGSSHGTPLGVLLLTQASHERVFERLAEGRHRGAWTIRLNDSEPQSLVAERGEDQIIVICGRQVRCDNGLEVAALGTTSEFRDGESFASTIGAVQDSGAFTVIPWGFGKWSAARGREVGQAINRNSARNLALGDNGGRLRIAGEPTLISRARAAGFKILSGSDPFPCGNDYRRIGGYGFFAGVTPSVASPWADLSAWLSTERRSPAGYGRNVGITRFLINQAGIRLYNRRVRSVDQ